MDVLGSVGQLYMFILLALLFLGSGFAVWKFINFIIERSATKTGLQQKIKPEKQADIAINKKKINLKLGGFKMANNGWIKLAAFSFVGILVSVVILGFVSTGGAAANNIHQQHQQQGMTQNAMQGTMQGGMNMSTPMGNMQMQGNMNGNMNMSAPIQGNMNGNEQMQQQLMMMQQQLRQMQMQLNQMQQSGLMNGNVSQNNSMGNMNGSSNMGGMNNMNSMPQNNSGSNNQQNNSGSSMGGMM